MIIIKTGHELQLMRDSGKIAANALLLAEKIIKPGVTTEQVDSQLRSFIEKKGGIPSFLGYNGFPASACISINNEVIHGIPNADRVIKEGDIVSVDIGVLYRGFHSDTARTFAAGKLSLQAKRLMTVTQECLQKGIEAAVASARIGDIGYAVQTHAEASGFSVVRKFVGHGVGASLHEEPEVPNFGKPGRGVRLSPGMTIAIEPMINTGTPYVQMQGDHWTVLTADGGLSAHFEHTVAITENGAEILTKA